MADPGNSLGAAARGPVPRAAARLDAGAVICVFLSVTGPAAFAVVAGVWIETLIGISPAAFPFAALAFALAPVAGIVVGARSLSRIARASGALGGRAAAVAGMVLCVLFLLWMAYVAASFYTYLGINWRQGLFR